MVKRAAERAVDHAMVVGQRQRQHQARHELPCRPTPASSRDLRHAEDRDFGRVDDRRERGAADAAQRRDREASRPACRPGRACRRAPSPPARPSPARSASTPFLSASLITGTTRPFGVSAAKPMWKYCLRIRFSPSSDALNVGILLQRRDARLDQERQHRHLDAGLRVLLVECDAERLELGDVGLVELRDVRDHHPVARAGSAPRDLLDARQRPASRSGRTWRSRPCGHGSRSRSPTPPPPRPRRRRRRRCACFTKACTSSCVMRPFGPVPLTCAESARPARARTCARRGCACGDGAGVAVAAPRCGSRRGRRGAGAAAPAPRRGAGAGFAAGAARAPRPAARLGVARRRCVTAARGASFEQQRPASLRSPCRRP